MNNINKEDIQKQSVGIDVSSKTLEVRLGVQNSKGQFGYTSCTTFKNKVSGFRNLLKWVRDQMTCKNTWFIMEATGVYYEGIAWFLHQSDLKVCVLVPNRFKHYANSLPIKSKTDAIDARILARYGLERQLRQWQPGSGKLRDIKALLRERQQLKKQRTQLKNRLHAARQAWQHPTSSIQRLKDHISRINNYLSRIKEELRQLWQSEQDLAESIKRIAKVGGVGTQTVLEVVAETNGFALVKNRNQLASYVGLDVILDQSGNRQGASKISKQGNAHIRRALYMPALAACRHNRALRAFYQRLLAKHPNRKKMALVAVMRKLLLLIYSLWKSGQSYDPDFHYQQIKKVA